MNQLTQPINSSRGSQPKTRLKPYRSPKKERVFSLFFLLLPLFLVMRLTILVRQRSGAEFSNVDSMAALQIVIVCLTFLLILIAPRVKTAWAVISKSAGLYLLLYYMIALCSFIWSALPQYTIYRAFEFLCQFFAVYLALFYSINYPSAEKKALTVSLIIILLGVGKHIKISGISLGALHTNSYSASAAMLFCYCLAEYFTAKKKRKRFLRNFGIVALLFLALGTSSASNIAALSGVTVVAVFHKNKTLLVLVACSLIAAPFLLSVGDITAIIFPGKSDEAIMSMTGRTSIWEMYMNMIELKPFLGYGFAASTRMSERYMTNTHNGFLAVILGTGLLGMSVFFMAFWRVLKVSLQNQRRKWIGSLGCFAAIIVGLVNNMAMSLVGEQWNPATMVFSIFFVLHILLHTKRRGQQT